MREVCVAVCLFLSLVEVHPLTEYLYISFMGQNLTNHSYVDLEGAQTVLDDPVIAQYTHTLTVTEAGRQGGLYTCTVANNKPSSEGREPRQC